MNMFDNIKVSMRMNLMVALTLAGLLVICLAALLQMKEIMIGDRKAKVRNLVEYAHTQLAFYDGQVQSGVLSLGQGQTMAKEALRKARYDGNEYFWLNDYHPRSVMHPIRPEIEGKDMTDNKDPSGKPLYLEFVRAVKGSGAGFVDYVGVRPGSTAQSPKLSYVKAFEPWGWVVGTGIYIDDVNAEFSRNATILGAVSAILLLILVVLGSLIRASIVRQLGGEPVDAAAVMTRVASGDLTAELGKPVKGSLLDTLDGMVVALRRLVREVNASAMNVAARATRIRHASDEIATAAEHQAASTCAMAAAIEELTASSSHIADMARDTQKDSRDAMSLAGAGSERVVQAADAIRKMATTVSDAAQRIHVLEERAGQVSSIASVIKEIAGQTNLLALNAAIEAARAGEQGRGFAVVADEVRKLAERTSSSTAEIEQMILGIRGDTRAAVEAMNEAMPEVTLGVELASHAAESLGSINDGARRTLDRIGEVASATNEQSSASTSIAQKVEVIAQMVEETTATVHATADTARELEQIAEELKGQVGRFKV